MAAIAHAAGIAGGALPDRSGPRPGTRLVRTEAIMGTTFELDVRDAPGTFDAAAVDQAFAWLHEADARFSTYRPASEISRIRAGTLSPADASVDVQVVLAECEALRRRTNGFFDARPYGPHSLLDPSGYVKGWALERAATILARGGLRTFALNGGGDIVARGVPAPDGTWRVGVRNPLDRERVAAVLGVSDLAVATSGGYERGDHVRDPHTGLPPTGVLSVTVVGVSMTVVDAFATAAFAMGRGGLVWLAAQSGFAACVITADGRLRSTPAFEAMRIRD